MPSNFPLLYARLAPRSSTFLSLFGSRSPNFNDWILDAVNGASQHAIQWCGVPWRMGALIPIHQPGRSPRSSLGLTAFVERDGLRPLRCFLVDISLQGASMWTPEFALPDVFVLKLGGGLRRACEVVWRKNNTVGAKFVSLRRMLGPAK